jgi:hypothetical protein
VLFIYEHGSNFRIADATHEKLLAEVSEEEFVPFEIPGRIRCDRLDEFIAKEKPDLKTSSGKTALTKFIEPLVPDAKQLVDNLADFIYTEAKLPGFDKNYLPSQPIDIAVDYTREQIIDCLQQLRSKSTTADLAFYAYRDMQTCDWTPFIKAAVERNPVSIEITKSRPVEEVFEWLEQMDEISIYSGKRLAQPDEVANYKVGDGLEKAFLLVNVIRQRSPEQDIEFTANPDSVVLKADGTYRFNSSKGLKKRIRISADGVIDT